MKKLSEKSKKELREEFAHAESAKTGAVRFSDEFVFWFAMFAAIVGNFFISVAIVPLLLVLKSAHLYFVLPALGIGMGSVFKLFMKSVVHLAKARHSLVWIVGALSGFGFVYIMALLANTLSTYMITAGAHIPALMAAIYSAGFALPFICRILER